MGLGGLDESALSKMCVRGTLRGGEEWFSGEGPGLVSEVGLGDWDIVRVRGGFPFRECARALACLGEIRCVRGVQENKNGYEDLMGGGRRELQYMSASARCGTCAGLAFGQGSMNEGVDVNGDVEVHVVRLRGGRMWR